MDSVIQFRGTIYENGYGLIAQKVMRDKDLDAKAKTIYAYLCSFAGVGKDGERTAFPGVSVMMHELGIKSDDTFYKYRKQLIDKGYITVEKQRKEGAKFDNNLYYINAVPAPIEEKRKPNPKKSGKDYPYPNFPSTDNPSTKKKGTNNNSIINNIFNIIKERESSIDPQLLVLLKELAPELEKRNKIFNDITDKSIEQIDYFFLKQKPEPQLMKKILIYIANYGEKIERLGGFLISTKEKVIKDTNKRDKLSKNKDKPYKQAYTIRKELTPQWLEEQRNGHNKSSDEQLDMNLDEKEAFEKLISSYKI